MALAAAQLVAAIAAEDGVTLLAALRGIGAAAGQVQRIEAGAAIEAVIAGAAD